MTDSAYWALQRYRGVNNRILTNARRAAKSISDKFWVRYSLDAMLPPHDGQWMDRTADKTFIKGYGIFFESLSPGRPAAAAAAAEKEEKKKKGTYDEEKGVTGGGRDFPEWLRLLYALASTMKTVLLGLVAAFTVKTGGNDHDEGGENLVALWLMAVITFGSLAFASLGKPYGGGGVQSFFAPPHNTIFRTFTHPSVSPASPQHRLSTPSVTRSRL